MLHRRDAMIRLGQLGLGAVTLPSMLHLEQAAAAPASQRRKAKACIYIFLWGGPPQQDLWDMKPDAPQGVRSLFKPIRTTVPGITICDQMPRLARHMDKVAVVRSLTHPSNVHEASVYHMLTGRQDPTLAIPRNYRQRSQFPFFGSVLSYFTKPGPLPASVTLPRPIGHDGITYAGTYAGFLGPRHDPMELQAAPMSREQAAHSLASPPDVDATRLLARRGLLRVIESRERRLQQKGAAAALGGFQEQAFRMVSSAAAKRAFRLDLETPATRDRFGRNEYGDSFLLARRLVEAGVRLVSVIWMYFLPSGRIANVWDNHGGGSVADFGTANGTEMLKKNYCIPPLDRAYAALLEDLSQRGLLEETLVVAVGEFGRTPRLNATGGRDHWGMCQSALLAGGGVRGGQVYGASDKNAAYPKDHPVSPEDLLATIHYTLGLAPDREIRDREGRPHRLSEGRPVLALL
jgi:hypothetical protein